MKLWQKTETGFVPLNETARDEFARFSFGEVAELKTIKKRQNERIRRLVALVQYGFDNWGKENKDFDVFFADVLIKCGYFHEVASLFNEGACKAYTMSEIFRQPEKEFKRLYQDVYDVIWDLVLEGVSDDRRAQHAHASKLMEWQYFEYKHE